MPISRADCNAISNDKRSAHYHKHEMSDAYICAFWGQCYQLNYGKNNMVVNAIASEVRIGEKKELGKRDFVLTQV